MIQIHMLKIKKKKNYNQMFLVVNKNKYKVQQLNKN